MEPHRPVRLPLAARACGPCTVCCTVVGVAEIGKGLRERCAHDTGVSCGIYAERPESCRTFSCLWLLGMFGPEGRPDKLGVMIDAGEILDTKTGEKQTILVVWEAKTGGFFNAQVIVPGFFERFASRGKKVLVMMADGQVLNFDGGNLVPPDFAVVDGSR